MTRRGTRLGAGPAGPARSRRRGRARWTLGVVLAILVPLVLWLRAGAQTGRVQPAAPAAKPSAERDAPHPHAATTTEGRGERSPPPGRRVSEYGGPRPVGDVRFLIVDRATGEPVSSELVLWPLAPSPDSLTLHRVHVPAEGLLVPGLAAGRYGAHARASRRTGPAFEAVMVRTGSSTIRLEIELPDVYRVRLSVRDERGRVLALGRRASGYSSLPEVTVPSVEGPPPPSDRPETSFGSAHISADGEGFFALGQVRDADGDRGGTPWFEVTPTGGTTVRVTLPRHELYSSDEPLTPAGELYLVGISLAPERVEERVFFRDGSRAIDVGAEIELGCEPLLSRTPPEEDAWRSVPYVVRAARPGGEVARASFTLGEQGLPERVVVDPDA